MNKEKFSYHSQLLSSGFWPQVKGEVKEDSLDGKRLN